MHCRSLEKPGTFQSKCSSHTLVIDIRAQQLDPPCNALSTLVPPLDFGQRLDGLTRLSRGFGASPTSVMLLMLPLKPL